MNGSLKRAALVAGAFLVFAACAKPPSKCLSPGNTPASHYFAGMVLLEKGRLDEAATKFERASYCDEKFSPALSGVSIAGALKARGITDGAHRKVETDRVRQGLKAAKKLLKTPEDEFAYYLASMRVDTAIKEGGWIDEVEESFKDASNLKVDNEKLLYYRVPEAADYFMGSAYLEAREFKKASERFAAVLNSRSSGRWHAPADSAWKRTDRVVRSLEGTTLGDAGRRIALLDKVTRGDMASFLAAELKTEKLFSGKPPSSPLGPEFVPSDLASSPFREEAAAIVRLNIRGLEASYDTSSRAYLFRPSDPVRRKELAMALEDFLIRLTGDEKLSTAFLGHLASPFTDVDPSAAWYNAVMSVTTRSIMDAGVSGEFRPEEPVDGAEAVMALRALKYRLNIE